MKKSLIVLILSLSITAFGKTPKSKYQLEGTGFRFGVLTFPANVKEESIARIGLESYEKIENETILDKWRSFGVRKPDIPLSTKWYVFDGKKNIGMIKVEKYFKGKPTERPPMYSSHGFVPVKKLENKYLIKNKDNDFYSFNGTDNYKALFLYNKKSYSDPDKWELQSDKRCYESELSRFVESLKKYKIVSLKTGKEYKGTVSSKMVRVIACLLYTSPSPRDS